jgi:S-ribosylhomocysteine lyase
MYISRVDGDITTFDIRMVKPNGGTYLSNPSMHTIEHLFATYARSSDVESGVVYVGPMGCRTGFYLLTKNIDYADCIKLVKDAYEFISKFEGEIPGAKLVECGNYLEHDLTQARLDVLPVLNALSNYTVEDLNYPADASLE